MFWRFLRFGKSVKRGFWIVELIVALAILSGLMLVLTKFGWHIMLVEHDSVKRMEAISCVSALIDEKAQKGQFSAFKGKKIGDFDLNCTISKSKMLANNFPEPIKRSLCKGLTGVERVEITVAFRSGFGKKREFCIVTGVLGGDH